MKKVVLILALFFSCIAIYTQANKQGITTETITETITETSRYKLYQTEATYVLLKLDTQTGKIWLVQWSLEDNRGEWIANELSLVTEVDGFVNGRFGLQPTKNIYNYILFDKIDGRVWQFQWGFEPENIIFEKI